MKPLVTQLSPFTWQQIAYQLHGIHCGARTRMIGTSKIIYRRARGSAFQTIFLTFVKHLTRYRCSLMYRRQAKYSPSVTYEFYRQGCLMKGDDRKMLSTLSGRMENHSMDCQSAQPEYERTSSTMERPRLRTRSFTKRKGGGAKQASV